MKNKMAKQQLELIETMAANGEDFSVQLCNNRYFYYVVMQTKSVVVQEWLLRNVPVDSIKELLAMNPNLDTKIGLRFWSEGEPSVCSNLAMNQSETVAEVHKKMAADILSESPVSIPIFDKVLVTDHKASILLSLIKSSLLDEETKKQLFMKLENSIYMTLYDIE